MSSNAELKILLGDNDDDALKKIFLSEGLFNCKQGSSHQEHSLLIDEIFGVNVPALEKKLLLKGIEKTPKGDRDSWGRSMHDGHQTWVGLHPETLQTSYAEIAEILTILSPQHDQHFLDLGAGYGRIGMVLHSMFFGCSFTGIEYVRERVMEGNRIFQKLDCINARLVEADVAHKDYRLSCADFFFLYDFGNSLEIQNVLQQLRKVMGNRPIKVIARGNVTRHFVHKEHAWLSDIFRPLHAKNYSIYSNFEDIKPAVTYY